MEKAFGRNFQGRERCSQSSHYHQRLKIQSFEPHEDWVWCYMHEIMGSP